MDPPVRVTILDLVGCTGGIPGNQFAMKKKYQTPTWKSQRIEVRGSQLVLKMGRGEPLVLRHPLPGVRPRQVELSWENGIYRTYNRYCEQNPNKREFGFIPGTSSGVVAGSFYKATTTGTYTIKVLAYSGSSTYTLDVVSPK